MKRLFIMLPFIALSACGKLTNASKHFHSSMTGLNYKVTLYGQNGTPIKTWITSAKIEDQGGSIFFVHEGKAVTIAGTFTIEEQ